MRTVSLCLVTVVAVSLCYGRTTPLLLRPTVPGVDIGDRSPSPTAQGVPSSETRAGLVPQDYPQEASDGESSKAEGYGTAVTNQPCQEPTTRSKVPTVPLLPAGLPRVGAVGSSLVVDFSYEISQFVDELGGTASAELLVDVIGTDEEMFDEKPINEAREEAVVKLVEVKGGEDVLVKAFQPTPPVIYGIQAIVEDGPKRETQQRQTEPQIFAIVAQVENGTDPEEILPKDEPSPESYQTDEEEWEEQDRKWNEMSRNRFDETTKQTVEELDWDEEWKTNYELEKVDKKGNNEERVEVEGEGDEGKGAGWRSTRYDRKLGPVKLEFQPPPDGEPYHIQSLGLSEGVFVFTYLGQFLSLIQPYDFPVELMRDALWKRVSIISLILQSLMVEAGFITCLVVGVVLALAVPILVMAHGCSRLCSRPSKHHGDSSSCGSSDSNRQLSCKRKTLIFFLIIIVILLGYVGLASGTGGSGSGQAVWSRALERYPRSASSQEGPKRGTLARRAGVTAMFVTNEQLSTAVINTPRVLHVALDDVSAYLRNSQRQLVHVITASLDRAVETISMDLDGIEKLLGMPIQNEISGETGVEVALESLMDVATATDSIGEKVETMQREGRKTRDMTAAARERLADLRQQVDSLRKQCSNQDRPLCDTIDSSGLDINFRVDTLVNDPRLQQLRTLRDENLPELAERVKGQFQYIPQQISRDTADARTEMKQELQRQKTNLDGSVWPVENLARDLRLKVEDAREIANLVDESLSEVEQWRWLTKLGMSVIVLFIWTLLLIAVICGCCDAEGTARSTLITSVVIICVSSVVLWSLTLSALMVGGHGEVFVCRPLYDEPEYRSLTELLDDPGILYQESRGFFSNLLYRNQTLDVPVRDVLRECETGRAVYPTFRLDKVFNVEASANHQSWGTFHSIMRRMETEVDISKVQIFDPELQRRLNSLGQGTSVNLTVYRAQLSKPVCGKDLASFAKQLDSVANQIKDLTTASRIETLASRTRRLLTANIEPLEKRKEELVYQVTALEVLLSPLQRQVNQTLSHLRTIQYFITNQGATIAQRKTREYVLRLANYLEQYRQYLLEAVLGHVAPCKPIWNLYHAVRLQLCRHLMDPLNGFWFASVWCLLIFVIATPICLKLVHCYSRQKEGILATSNGHSSTSSNDNWNSPGSGNTGNGW